MERKGSSNRAQLFTQYKNKPYEFVQLTKVRRVEPIDRVQLLTLTETLVLQIKIKVLTPLHFGSGRLILQHTGFVESLPRINEQIRLPGSAFKGMLRNVVETISNSCVTAYPMVKNNPHPALPVESTTCDPAKVCLACSLFGTAGRRGKLAFTDFALCGEPLTKYYEIPTLYPPFTDYALSEGLGNERLYFGKLNGLGGLEVAKLTKPEFWARKKKEIAEKEANLTKQNNQEHTNQPQCGTFYGRKFYKHSIEKWRENIKINAETSVNQVSYECLDIGSV
ncbi:MAG: RAMP superfamily CRISPR-associated protein, partial [Lachnospiraceae bacterium]|nr:RAMP superfamily CRISPR-associated protein [Lachnospiraceae bacterium]